VAILLIATPFAPSIFPAHFYEPEPLRNRHGEIIMIWDRKIVLFLIEKSNPLMANLQIEHRSFWFFFKTKRF
jgi:hypothetical protein